MQLIKDLLHKQSRRRNREDRRTVLGVQCEPGQSPSHPEANWPMTCKLLLVNVKHLKIFHFIIGDSLNLVEVFDPVGNFWERCQPMRTARSRVGVAVVNGLLYAIGGYDGQSRLSTVEVYNPETDSWTRVSSMNSQRR